MPRGQWPATTCEPAWPGILHCAGLHGARPPLDTHARVPDTGEVEFARVRLDKTSSHQHVKRNVSIGPNLVALGATVTHFRSTEWYEFRGCSPSLDSPHAWRGPASRTHRLEATSRASLRTNRASRSTAST